MSAHDHMSPEQFGDKYGSSFSVLGADWEHSAFNYGRSASPSGASGHDVKFWNDDLESRQQAARHGGGTAGRMDWAGGLPGNGGMDEDVRDFYPQSIGGMYRGGSKN